jgi:DNA polymerase III epsilon subunit-like protein
MTNRDSRFAYPGWQGPFVRYCGIGNESPSDAEYVVLDVETTGFDPSLGDRILEISAIRTDGKGNVMNSFTSLVNPGVADTGAEHIHGISVAMLEDAPRFDEIFGHLAQLMDDAIFVAHHAKFDESFIGHEAALASITLNTMPGLCTYWLAKQTLTSLPNHKLSNLAQYWNLETGIAHCAYDDALVVVHMLPRLLELVEGIEHFAPVQQQSAARPTASPCLR